MFQYQKVLVLGPKSHIDLQAKAVLGPLALKACTEDQDAGLWHCPGLPVALRELRKMGMDQSPLFFHRFATNFLGSRVPGF